MAEWMFTVELPDNMKLEREDTRKRREEYDKKNEEARKFVENYTAKIAKSKVWLLFLFDATASMQEYIRSTREVVIQIARSMSLNMEEVDLKVGVVAYRDPLDCEDDVHEVLKPGPVATFKEFMGNVRAYGGGDDAEDVAGGMAHLVEMLNDLKREYTKKDVDKDDDVEKEDKEKETKDDLKEEVTDQTLLVIHVTDATPHGFAINQSDRFDTEEERNRLRAETKALVELGNEFTYFHYHYYALGNHAKGFADQMRDLIFPHISNGKSIHDVFENVSDIQDYARALMSTTFSSVARSVSMNTGGFVDPFSCQPTLNDDAKSFFTTIGFDFTASVSKTALCEGLANRSTIGLLHVSTVQPLIPESRNFLQQLIEYSKMASYDTFISNLCSVRNAQKNLEYETKRETERVLVVASNKPYGVGTDQIVFHSFIVPESSLLRKKEDVGEKRKRDDLKTLTRFDMKDVLFEDSVVKAMLKFPKRNSPVNLEVKMDVYSAVAYLLRYFNSANANRKMGFKHIRLLSPFILKVGGETRYMETGKNVFLKKKNTHCTKLIAEYSLAEYDGYFEKFVNNNNIHLPTMDPSMNECYFESHVAIHAFMFFCWYVTQGNLIPTDIQGKFVSESSFRKRGQNANDTFLLTDIAILANNFQAFDSNSNLGPVYVKATARTCYKNLRTSPQFPALLGLFSTTAEELDKKMNQ